MPRCQTYAPGQCTDGACRLAGWVQEDWGNAGEWADNAARAGFSETIVPTVGAVVVYAAGDGYSVYGHCGVVREVYGRDSFLVREMNYAVWNDYDDRVSNLYDVAAFILPPGVGPGGTGGAPGGGGTVPAPNGLEPALSAWGYLQDYLNRRAAEQEYWLGQVGVAIGGIQY